MRTLLTNIAHLALFADARTEMTDAAVLIEGTGIAAVGRAADKTGIAADRVVDLAGHVVMPGLVNTHHHMYQNLTRVMVQDDPLFVWLRTLYPIWARIDDDAIRVSARMAMAELIASGCTTSSDHLHILPNDCRPDAARGAMSRGESKGGLPHDSCVEEEGAILKDAERLIAATTTWPPMRCAASYSPPVRRSRSRRA